MAAVEVLALQVDELSAQEYEFLYDESRHLLAIGYNVTEQRRDPSYYDLLASEARLCSFVGIAQGRLPQESWFALGRLLTHAAGEPILLSWSGSMFEYLMPLLVMPTFANTLLDQTAHAAVKRQIQYGNQRGVPWGISECGYNTVDAALNYQYRAFGVPGLGLQRGLAEDLVIAPYASALALMIKPREACSNLQRLAAAGCLGRFGMYEAVDYTPARLRRGETSAIVRSFMAHHQGMTLLSLAYLLLDRPMQARFESVAQFQSTLLLLQERVPKDRALYSNNPELVDLRAVPEAAEPPVRVLTTPDTPTPAVQLLSNGRYHVMVTNAGGGYSRWREIAVTRWREDTTCDSWGTFCYLRDGASGRVWSPAFVPAGLPSTAFEASFTESRVEFRRRDEDFETHTEIVVSPEDDIELRRMRITNFASRARTVDVVSYAEVVLASAASDALHPAFSNLFVQTEIISARQAILCTRRPRAARRIRTQPRAPHDGAWRDGRRSVVRNGSRAIHWPRQQRGQPTGASQRCCAVRHPGIRAGSHRRHPAAHHPRAETDRDGRSRHRHRRGSRRMPFPDGKVPGSAARESRVRDGVDPQPGRAAPTQHHRSRCAALRTPDQLDSLCQRIAAGRTGRDRRQSTEPIGVVGLCDLR